MKVCIFSRIGSPFASRGAVMTVPAELIVISTLLPGNTGEPGGTKAIPFGPRLPRVLRRIADIMLNVPLPSGAKSQWYQCPVLQAVTFMLPADGNPGGTKATEQATPDTPIGVRSTILSGAMLPVLLCSISLPG